MELAQLADMAVAVLHLEAQVAVVADIAVVAVKVEVPTGVVVEEEALTASLHLKVTQY